MSLEDFSKFDDQNIMNGYLYVCCKMVLKIFWFEYLIICVQYISW